MWNDRLSRTRIPFHFQRILFCFQIDPDFITTSVCLHCVSAFDVLSELVHCVAFPRCNAVSYGEIVIKGFKFK